jgi:hypothetical protein
MKGILVTNVITILDGADHAEVDALLAAEAVRAKELAAAGMSARYRDISRSRAKPPLPSSKPNHTGASRCRCWFR